MSSKDSDCTRYMGNISGCTTFLIGVIVLFYKFWPTSGYVLGGLVLSCCCCSCLVGAASGGDKEEAKVIVRNSIRRVSFQGKDNKVDQDPTSLVVANADDTGGIAGLI